jgi:beta-glucosidase
MYVVGHLKGRVELWITFNEALSVYAGFSYLNGQWPPQHKNIFEYHRVRKNFIKAHTFAYQEIKKIYDVSPTNSEGFVYMSHNVAVGIAENNVYSAHGNRWYEKAIGRIYSYQRNLYFLDKALPYFDFISLNYYHVDRRVPGSYRVLSKQDWMPEMNWETYPKGIYYRLTELQKFKKPIFITENGIADRADHLREKFIKDHLYWIWRAIQDGVEVRGYLYWSLLDNFEWHLGFTPRFGLVEIDYATLNRKIRPSAYEYAKICKAIA